MQVRATGIPWYRPKDYDRLKAMFTDGRELPDTFDSWLSRAKAIYDRLTKEGHVVHQAFIDPDAFPEWCRVRRLEMNAQARSQYAGEYAAQSNKATRRFWE